MTPDVAGGGAEPAPGASPRSPSPPDPEVLAGLRAIFAAQADDPVPEDFAGVRAQVDARLTERSLGMPQPGPVEVRSHAVPVGGHVLEVREYTAPDARDAAVLFVHGGGMILGSLDVYDGFVRSYAAEAGVRFFAVEYRLAPEHPHPTPVGDCYAALVWLAASAPALGLNPARLAVMGDSAGGGLAAAVALLARDRGGPALSAQVLLYPMLDDLNTSPDPDFGEVLMWSWVDNAFGWDALLGPASGGDDVSPYAAPARAQDVSGLPPTYLEVGDLDIFRDEDVLYAERLAAAGVPVEHHLVVGVPHAYEMFVPDAAVSRAARARRLAFLRRLAG